ncbi:MAG: nuclear transport factor 2 family protein [Xanthomonadales bacterium]|nr:nuclear transport factor 2 family protein [Xanthomonadales bacterium]
MSNPDNQELIDRYLLAYNSFDIDGMLALLSPDIRFENYSGGQLTDTANGIAEFRGLAEKSKSLFSEREQHITKLTLGQDSAVVDIAYRGQLAADIPGGPSAGTVLDLQGQSEFSFKGGQISKIVDRS